jgi:hypothetical protein
MTHPPKKMYRLENETYGGTKKRAIMGGKKEELEQIIGKLKEADILPGKRVTVGKASRVVDMPFFLDHNVMRICFMRSYP